MKKIKFILFIFTILIFSCDEITAPTIPNIPSNLHIDVLDVSHINLRWQFSGGTYGDSIQFTIAKKVGEDNWDQNFNTVIDNRIISDQIRTTDSLIYAYKVKAKNLSINTEYAFSDPIAYFSDEAAPTNFTLSQTAQDSVKITWQDNCVGEEGYCLEKRINNEKWISPYLKIESNTESYIDKVNAFESIEYRLFAYFGDSESNSLNNSIKTTLGAPSHLQLTKPDVNKIRLNWVDNSFGEDGFYIDRKLGELPWETKIATIDSNKTFWIDDVDFPAATLQYRVCSYLGEISSSYCETQTVNVRLDLIGSFKTAGEAIDIEVNNLFAFVADNYNGLEVIDCNNTDKPSQLVNLEIPDRTLSASLSGNFIYVASNSGKSPGLLTKIDLSVPENPYITGSAKIDGVPNGIAVAGDHAYIASGKAGLTTAYISSMSPIIITNTSTNGLARNLCLDGHYAYITNGLDGFSIMDVQNPANPSLIASLPASGLANNIAIANGIAFVTNGEDGLDIFDVNNASAPFLLKNYQTNGFVYDVAVQDNYVYLIDKDLGIIILDISDINNPYQIAIYPMQTKPVSVYNFGSYLFITDNEGMKIIQVRS